jgi:methylamine--corrinoid protein Co-methyltransferase
LDYTGPIEACFASEMAHAVAGKSRQEVNKMVQYLLTKYEDKIRTPAVGKKIQECFDLATGTPEQEYLKMHREIRREMIDQLGLQFTDASPYI